MSSRPPTPSMRLKSCTNGNVSTRRERYSCEPPGKLYFVRDCRQRAAGVDGVCRDGARGVVSFRLLHGGVGALVDGMDGSVRLCVRLGRNRAAGGCAAQFYLLWGTA